LDRKSGSPAGGDAERGFDRDSRATLRIDNIGQLGTAPVGAAANAWGVHENVAIAIAGERILALGPQEEIAGAYPVRPDQRIDARSGVVLPGWIDPHTHLLFAGSRENEFELRCGGATYQEIAAGGGGIRKSVRDFRAASDVELLAQSRRRLDRMFACGATTVEVKSGYGLSLDEELRALRLIRELDRTHPVDLVPTFMGAHETPDEHRSDRAGYIRLVTEEMIPLVAREKLAVFCDVFCEAEVFDVAETRTILEAARRHGLELKLHAEEFEPIGGVSLGVELGATSVDHLIAVDAAGIQALVWAASRPQRRPVAVLLPSTSFTLAKGRYAPARELLDRGALVALATDCNPGSSHNDSMPFVVQLAVLQMNLHPAEAMAAATRHAALACGVGEDRGVLAPGYLADLQILDAPSWLWVASALGLPHVRTVVKRGRAFEIPRWSSRA